MPPHKAVLVVDDDWDLREAIRDTLAVEGYETSDASDGLTALEHLRTHRRPGVILLDWNMAPMNGGEFMAEFTHEPAISNVPVVLLTADVRVEAKARSHPFAACLKKPVELPALLSIVARYCRGESDD
jgi:CheY-like chemotaxis protein